MANNVETSDTERQAVLVGCNGDGEDLKDYIFRTAKELSMKISVLVLETLQDLKRASLKEGLTLAVIDENLSLGLEEGETGSCEIDAVDCLERANLSTEKIIMQVDPGSILNINKNRFEPLRIILGERMNEIKIAISEILKAVDPDSNIPQQELEFDQKIADLLKGSSKGEIDDKEIVTICSSCLQIREGEAGPWKDIFNLGADGSLFTAEARNKIRKNASALYERVLYSDGICPCCMQKLYPTYA